MKNVNKEIELRKLKIQELQLQLEQECYYLINLSDNFIINDAPSTFAESLKNSEELKVLPFSVKHIFLEQIDKNIPFQKGYDINNSVREKLNTKITAELEGKDFVVVVFSENGADRRILKNLFQAIAGEKIGKFYPRQFGNDLSVEYEAQSILKLKDDYIKLGVKKSELNHLEYQGHPLTGENVVFIGDELGNDIPTIKLLEHLHPKKILNIIIRTDRNWFEMVD